MMLLSTLFVFAAAAAVAGKEEISTAAPGVWDDKDGKAESYYEDEDFFSEKKGKVRSVVQQPVQGDKTFFLETKTSTPVKEGHTRIQALKKAITKKQDAMRFKETRNGDNQEEATIKRGEAQEHAMPPLPRDGIFHDFHAQNPTDRTGGDVAGFPPCGAFSNTPAGQQLLATFHAMNPAAYAGSPCAMVGVSAQTTQASAAQPADPNFADKAPAPPSSVLVPLTGIASAPYYSQPIERMIPQLQWPYMGSPEIRFYSDGMRYPANMEHYDDFGTPAVGAAGAAPPAGR